MMIAFVVMVEMAMSFERTQIVYLFLLTGSHKEFILPTAVLQQRSENSRCQFPA